MDWATEASVEIILALAFGCFIGWIIVTAIKTSQRRERKQGKQREEQRKAIEDAKYDLPHSYAYLDTLAKIEKARAMRESSKQPETQQGNESGGIDEYHK